MKAANWSLFQSPSAEIVSYSAHKTVSNASLSQYASNAACPAAKTALPAPQIKPAMVSASGDAPPPVIKTIAAVNSAVVTITINSKILLAVAIFEDVSFTMSVMCCKALVAASPFVLAAPDGIGGGCFTTANCGSSGSGTQVAPPSFEICIRPVSGSTRLSIGVGSQQQLTNSQSP